MIDLIHPDTGRRDYLESVGVPISHEDAVKELRANKPLLPVCLVTFPMFMGAYLCFTEEDIRKVDGLTAIKWEWFIVDIAEIENDFPQLVNAIDSYRRTPHDRSTVKAS